MRTKSIEIKDSFIDAAPTPPPAPPQEAKPAPEEAPDTKSAPHGVAAGAKVEKLDLKSSFEPVTRHDRPDPTPPPLSEEDFPLHPRSEYSPTKKL